MSDDALLERVEALLARATDDGASEEEARTCALVAARIIRREKLVLKRQEPEPETHPWWDPAYHAQHRGPPPPVVYNVQWTRKCSLCGAIIPGAYPIICTCPARQKYEVGRLKRIAKAKREEERRLVREAKRRERQLVREAKKEERERQRQLARDAKADEKAAAKRKETTRAVPNRPPSKRKRKAAA